MKTYLDKDIVPSKSSFRVKKNRVVISLWKADKNHSWMNLTEKNPGKSLKPSPSDPAAGIMDMMKVSRHYCAQSTISLVVTWSTDWLYFCVSCRICMTRATMK